MVKPRMFWLYSNRKTIKELTFEEWRTIATKEWNWDSNAKMLCRVYDNEVYFRKGNSSFWVDRNQLEKILGMVEK